MKHVRCELPGKMVDNHTNKIVRCPSANEITIPRDLDEEYYDVELRKASLGV